MFKLIYVVLSVIYSKTVNFLLGARKIYPKFFKDMFDRNHVNIPVLSKFQSHTHYEAEYVTLLKNSNHYFLN